MDPLGAACRWRWGPAVGAAVMQMVGLPLGAVAGLTLMCGPAPITWSVFA
jgi:hypothetical protein